MVMKPKRAPSQIKQLPELVRSRAGSGGPQTPAGKEAVKWNALKHGLCAQVVVIQAGEGQESQEEFDGLMERLWADLQPQGALEEMLVERIGICHWRLRRCLQAEVGETRKELDSCRLTWLRGRATAFETAIQHAVEGQRLSLQEDSISLQALIRNVAEARQELTDLGHLSEWRKGFLLWAFVTAGNVPWESPEAALAWLDDETDEMQKLLEAYLKKETLELEALKASLTLPRTEAVDKILRYETTISRLLSKAMAELERLQRLRKGEPVPPPLKLEVTHEG
jgi:hypothetical protein